MNNDLKSSEALKAYAREVLCGNNPTNSLLIRMFDEIIDNAPSQWIPVSEKLPEEKNNPRTNDLEYVLCSTIWDDVRPYKFGKRIGENKAHFWLGGGIMDKYVTAWQSLPEPYKKEGEEE